MASDFVLCDVFADRPFVGNPLAVFLDGSGISDQRMFALAREFNWSEITFVLEGSGSALQVRIWTPHGELPFAGHPTVGTAVVLASAGRTQVGTTTLQLGIGPVEVEVQRADQAGGSAAVVQRPPDFGDRVGDRDLVARALGLQPDDLDQHLPIQYVSTGLRHLLIPVRTTETLERVRVSPDHLPALLAGTGAPYVYVFVPNAGDKAARSRLVGIGIEDAATGSAAGPLGAYLVRHGVREPGYMEIEQGIEMGRPSLLRVEVSVRDGEIGPVRVSGEVQIWGRGRLES